MSSQSPFGPLSTLKLLVWVIVASPCVIISTIVGVAGVILVAFGIAAMIATGSVFYFLRWLYPLEVKKREHQARGRT